MQKYRVTVKGVNHWEVTVKAHPDATAAEITEAALEKADRRGLDGHLSVERITKVHQACSGCTCNRG